MNFNPTKFIPRLEKEIRREQNKLKEHNEFLTKLQIAQQISPAIKFWAADFYADFEVKQHDKKYFRNHFKSLPFEYEKNLLRYRRRTKKYFLTSDEHEKMTDFYILFYYHTSEYQKLGIFPFFIENDIMFFDSRFLLNYQSGGQGGGMCFQRYKRSHTKYKTETIENTIKALSDDRLNKLLLSKILSFCSQCQMNDNVFLSEFEA